MSMKKLIYLLLAMPLFIASCNNDDIAVNEETVEVSFIAKVPQSMGSRAASTLSVDRVYCAIFEDGEEISSLREVISIEDGKDIVFSPRLIKGRTYDVVFWAAKEGFYNVEDMTSISPNSKADVDGGSFDAFTAHTTVSVNNTQTNPITLKRPFAQMNIGVTEEDWNGVASPTTFNQEPTHITVSFRGKDTFDALTGTVIGEDKTITYNLCVSGNYFTCADIIYKNIAQCFILPGVQKENFDITFTLYDQNNKVIRDDVVIYNVPLQTNYKTNIVGGLLTGTVTYEISFEEGFNATEDIIAVLDSEDLLQVLTQEGGKVMLMSDITVDDRIDIPAGTDVYLDMNGKKISSSADYVFIVRDGASLTITGNGIIETETPAPVLFYPAGDLVIENGTFVRNIPEGYAGSASSMFVGTKPAGGWHSSGVTINGGYFDSGYYDKNAADIEEILAGTKELEETHDDIIKRGAAGDKNKVRVALKNNCMAMFNKSNNYFKIYGGTFVGANPAWGDEGCMLPTTPYYLRPWSYYQGALLDGQEFHEDGIVLPEGYEITRGKTEKGITTYTVNYNK